MRNLVIRVKLFRVSKPPNGGAHNMSLYVLAILYEDIIFLDLRQVDLSLSIKRV